MSKTKIEVDQINHDFLVGTLQNMETKNAQLTVALGVSEGGELLICSTNRLTNREVYNLLQEAARALQHKPGQLILLQ